MNEDLDNLTDQTDPKLDTPLHNTFGIDQTLNIIATAPSNMGVWVYGGVHEPNFDACGRRQIRDYAKQQYK